MRCIYRVAASLHDFELKYLSFYRQNIKIWLVTLEPSMWVICMPNFSPLASLVWEEEVVTDVRKDGQTSVLATGHNISSNSSLALLVRDKQNKLSKFVLVRRTLKFWLCAHSISLRFNSCLGRILPTPAPSNKYLITIENQTFNFLPLANTVLLLLPY